MVSLVDDAPPRTQTPVAGLVAAADNAIVPSLMPEASTQQTDLQTLEDDYDARRAVFADLYRRSEAKVALLFSDDGSYNHDAIHALLRPPRPAGSGTGAGVGAGSGGVHPYLPPPATDHAPISEPPFKKAKRAIDEDNYDDDEDEEDGEDEDKAGGGGGGDGSSSVDGVNKSMSGPNGVVSSRPPGNGPPLQLLSPSKTGSSPVHSVGSPEKQPGKPYRDDRFTVSGTLTSTSSSLSQQQQQQSSLSQKAPQAKTSDDVRKELEEARNATEEAARRSFYTLFYTLENDRTAMLEQQQLEESEKQIQAEMEKNGPGGANGGAGANNHGTLSSANLGASSLTLKHLIARIDQKRDHVKATDAELRSLINEVRKNRSKWASEENVGQEELYEALEKVLSELKAHTEYSTPFLQRVNKREAPDYHLYVKQPMDLGTMTKKLKGLQYKSKAEFVHDLNLVWDNCLKYNRDAGHPLRRMANGMRKEAEKLIPLIPDLTIRSRAEVEAEERRKQNGGDDDGGDDSDDEPIMSSRGRKTGTKSVANKSRSTGGHASTGGTTTSAGASSGGGAADQKEGTPGGDHKPVLQLNGLLAKAGREGSEFGDGSNGFATPPIGGGGAGGSLTPLNNQHSGLGSSTGGDAMDLDAPSSVNGIAALNRALDEAADEAYEDEAYQIWKQVTKKDRALLAQQRYELFKGNKLNVDEPALLRSKAGMRWYLKSMKQAEAMGILGPGAAANADATVHGGGAGGDVGGGEVTSSLAASSGNKDGPTSSSSTSKPGDTTLAEGMEDDVEKVVPDYYEPTSIVPDIPTRLQWVEDDEGHVVNQNEEFLRMLPAGQFVAPPSRLAKRFDANMRQIQETRKVCSKISVVKQMQIQTQIYQNQFQRYDPEPFHEADVEPHFISGDGPFMAAETSRAALQRSVAKIFFHAGFEELQPSAMDAIADIAGDYFTKLCRTFNVYNEAEKRDAAGAWAARGARFQPRYTPEEVVLHTLYENGHDLDSLDAYAREDVERLGVKLGGIHDRMKAHLSDLLRPALQDGAGTAEAFHDGSEQFVGGDFAEELGEDFFGFKALGLDRELGLDILSVPLHLLQTRVRNQHAVDAPVDGVASAALFEAPEPLDPVTTANVVDEIGLVKNFFLAKLHANSDQPLVEDEDLPVKQRRPRPRLGATGKIVSPQKRAPKEQLAMAKRKKREMAAAAAAAAEASAGGGGGGGGPTGNASNAGPGSGGGGGSGGANGNGAPGTNGTPSGNGPSSGKHPASGPAPGDKVSPAKKQKTGPHTSVPVPHPGYSNGTGNGTNAASNLPNGTTTNGTPASASASASVPPASRPNAGTGAKVGTGPRPKAGSVAAVPAGGTENGERTQDQGSGSGSPSDDKEEGGLMSPESIER
ncbi:transcriptional activator spt7 [Niveomyces insectorum RCEF 264]|uniref:SAGA complex subunit Spt7 n=1 Tax=Niveomyces insectorum RCEF 264 TaxID=1081102 RepID=A0A167S4J9_9HYPO|nr:transcriptional activator spt7 [Niveomyces insectorum RCEF 264]